jgi:hypothetical protein
MPSVAAISRCASGAHTITAESDGVAPAGFAVTDGSVTDDRELCDVRDGDDDPQAVKSDNPAKNPPRP